MRHTSSTVYLAILYACLAGATGCNDDTGNDTDPPSEHALWSPADGECGDGVVEGWEECDDGVGMPNSTCYQCRHRAPMNGEPLDLPAEANDWAYYEIDGATCRDGSQAGFSVSPGTDTRKLLVYFEGGGACFEAFNCGANPRNISQGAQMPAPGGIFDRTHEENPFRDWTIVYLPYCSGDVFAGSATDVSIEHVSGTQDFTGDDNMRRFLHRIVPTFDEVEHVVSAGISAGGLASVVNTKRLARAFPDARVTVLDDGGPPLSTNVVTECLQKHWNDLYNLKETVLPDCGWNCPKNNDLLLPMAQDLVTSNDRIDLGLFSFRQDATVRLLFTFGLQKCKMIFIPLMPPEVLEDGLFEFRQIMDTTGAESPDARAMRTATYYAPGTSHVCINSNCFYDTVVDGVPLTQWTRDLLDRSFAHVGQPND